MTFAQRQQDLHEDLPDYVLLHEVLIFLQSPNQLRQIAVFAILHDYKYFLRRAVDEVLMVPHNVRVAQFGQAVDLTDDLVSLARTHMAVVDFLPGVILFFAVLFILVALHLVDEAVRTLSDFLNDRVVVH